MLDALTLLCAVTHTVESFSTVPRALATSPEKESGKSTLLDIAIMLSNNGWEADPTSYALRAKFNEPERPTLVIDEISDIFGQSGLRGQSNPVGKILRKGYRQTATLSMAVDRAQPTCPATASPSWPGSRQPYRRTSAAGASCGT